MMAWRPLVRDATVPVSGPKQQALTLRELRRVVPGSEDSSI
ncbi:hypothetical protein SETIT_9G445600v2 [Setaria italica]|uniref:Uncharacterized protein n=1 Tax=Setaria italica TaxID=4555 RepID=A0A368SSI1_SETIT|nr:hypothetical protein SETIT_9G445600v2 [Setaria italica]